MNSTQMKFHLIDVTPENVAEVGIFCIKNPKSDGFQKKVTWFKDKINSGLTMKIAVDDKGKQLAFIEWIPSELCWRPIKATNYLFIQCIALFVAKAKNQGIGSELISQCLKEARRQKKEGVCALTSDGPWMATSKLFEKNGFAQTDAKGRFLLMYKPFKKTASKPTLNDWTKNQAKYKGWNLVYSDQCPWHDKSVADLQACAIENGIELKVKRIKTPAEAQKAPSGFGTYTLIKDGKELADHYISRKRFENILKKELAG